MSNVNVFLQRPGAGAPGESPMQRAGLFKPGRGSTNPGVVLRERGLLGHLVLRGDARDDAFAGGVHKALGIELPGALTVVARDGLSLQWLAPDEWLLIVPGGEELAYEQALRAALGELHHSVVNVSGGQTLLELSGPNARDVLMKSTPYDVHPRSFPVGKAIGSVFAKSQCLIRRSGEDSWELVVRRSFSDYFALWLTDAAQEFGLRVEQA